MNEWIEMKGGWTKIWNNRWDRKDGWMGGMNEWNVKPNKRIDGWMDWTEWIEKTSERKDGIEKMDRWMGGLNGM